MASIADGFSGLEIRTVAVDRFQEPTLHRVTAGSFVVPGSGVTVSMHPIEMNGKAK